MEALLGSDPPLHWKAWHQIKGWYQATVYRAPPAAWLTLHRITAERVELYSYVPPPRANIPISIHTFLVDDLVPIEDEIEWAVKHLRNHCSGGPSGMLDKNLKGWLAAARKNEQEEAAAGEETTEGNNDSVSC